MSVVRTVPYFVFIKSTLVEITKRKMGGCWRKGKQWGGRNGVPQGATKPVILEPGERSPTGNI